MLCYLLHHLNDVQLRHRVEYTISFAQGYMGALQTDQLRRYVEIKQSDMPSAVAAKKTKEFRCPPRDQVNSHGLVLSIVLKVKSLKLSKAGEILRHRAGTGILDTFLTGPLVK